MFGLPPSTTRFTVERNVRVPLRDGVTLAADLFRPRSASLGTLLVRGPYGRHLAQAMPLARVYAARGYTVLFVSSRGTFGSGGDFDPMRTEAPDGHDVVRWMIAQPWFTGRFATAGLSYLGHTQWALLADPPPELATAIITVGPHDFARHAWGTGALNLDLLGWSDLVAHQEDGNPFRQIFRQITAARRQRPVLAELPLADAGERFFAGRAPWYRERVTRPDLDDPYWAPMRHGVALDRAEVPVLLVGGWQDLFLGQTIEQYERLHARGVEVGLTVGPWTHLDVASKAAALLAGETLEWLGEHLADLPRKRTSPVRVSIDGQWRQLPSWPPPTDPQTWHPQPGGRLEREATDDGDAAFTFDPADPTPTVGGPLLSGGGIVDDSALAERPDVLAFTSPPLTADLELIGAAVLTLEHHSDNPHVDVFARISEVDDRGRSRNVTEGYLRLGPERPVTLPLRPAAHRFAAGHRLRLLIAGGSHPQFARNLGTGENPGTGTTLRPATHSIALGIGTRLVLPVTSDQP